MGTKHNKISWNSERNDEVNKLCVELKVMKIHFLRKDYQDLHLQEPIIHFLRFTIIKSARETCPAIFLLRLDQIQKLYLIFLQLKLERFL